MRVVRDFQPLLSFYKSQNCRRGLILALIGQSTGTVNGEFEKLCHPDLYGAKSDHETAEG